MMTKHAARAEGQNESDNMVKSINIKWLFAAISLLFIHFATAQVVIDYHTGQTVSGSREGLAGRGPVMAADTSGPGTRISGRAVSPDGEGIPYAAVTMRNDDSQTIYGAACTTAGEFSIKVPAGAYRMEVTCIGYEKHSARIDIGRDTVVGDIILRMTMEELAAVTVKASNITHNAKGYVMNVGSNPLYKGYDLTDVLSTAPGIVVTDNAVQSFGRNVAMVYIDERPVRFTAETLIAYLRSRRAENIRSIELIASAGVEESASTMGQAVLRITTNKLYDGGFGSVIALGRLSNAFSSFVTTATTDMKAGKFSLYAYVAPPIYSNSRTRSEYYTENLEKGASTLSTSERSNINRFRNLSGNIGIGYDFNDRNLLTVEAGFGTQPSSPGGFSVSENMAGGLLAGRGREKSSTSARNRSASVSMQYISKFEDKGRLKVNGSWRRTKQNSTARYDYQSEAEALIASWLDTDAVVRSGESFSAEAGYTRPMRGEKGALAAGASWQLLKNSYDHTLTIEGKNPEMSHRVAGDYLFDYDENLSAAYIKYGDRFGNLSLEAGVRAEYAVTRMAASDDKVTRRHAGIFPNVALGYTLDRNRGHILALDLARSVSRPFMEQLNPNVEYTSVNSYRVGNPYLKPAFTNRVSLRLTLFNKYALNLSYSSSDGNVQAITEMDDDGLMRTSNANTAAARSLAIYYSVPVKLARGLMLYHNSSFSHNRMRYGGRGYINNSVNITGALMYNLPHGFIPRMNISWGSSSLSGNSLVRSGRPSMSIELQKNFKGRLIVAASAGNLLGNGKNLTETFGTNYYSYSRSRMAVRSYMLRLNYNFRWGNRNISVSHTESGGERL